MSFFRSAATGFAALTVVAIAGAQASGINGTSVHPYVWADFPNSGFTYSGTFPSLTFDDPNVNASGQGSGSGGYANRHIWYSSNDGGQTDYMTTGPNDFFNFTFSIKLTAVDQNSRKEAGVFLHTGSGTNLDCQYIITSNSGNAGEIAAFGGAFPFYSFTNSNSLRYTEGQTVQMGIRYFQDPTDTGHTYHFQYMYNGVYSPSMRLGNNFDVSGLPAGTLIGDYLQVPKDPNDPNAPNGGHVDWTNISITPGFQIVYADGYSLPRGNLFSGGLSDLMSSDNSRMVFQAGVIPFLTDYPVQVVLTGTSPTTTPTDLKFKLESQAQFLHIGQTIQLFNFTTNSYDTIDFREDGTTDQVVEIDVPNPQNYIDPRTLQVKAEIKYRATAIPPITAWKVGIDQAIWEISQ